MLLYVLFDEALLEEVACITDSQLRVARKGMRTKGIATYPRNER